MKLAEFVNVLAEIVVSRRVEVAAPEHFGKRLAGTPHVVSSFEEGFSVRDRRHLLP